MVTIDPNDLVIRPLHEDDYEAIVDIDTRAAGRPRHDYIGRKFEQAIQSAGQLGTSYVATTGSEVLAFIMGDVYLGEFGIPGDTATIDTIGVNPDYEGNGIARRLLSEFVNHCRFAGVKRIQTLVEWTDADLLRFFDHMGFVPAKALSLEKSLED